MSPLAVQSYSLTAAVNRESCGISKDTHKENSDKIGIKTVNLFLCNNNEYCGHVIKEINSNTVHMWTWSNSVGRPTIFVSPDQHGR